MSFHPSLVPLEGTDPAYGWTDVEEIGSGGFATVRALGPSEVIKLSCCTASNDWMASAPKRTCKGPSKWPRAFPAVLENLGPQGKDDDGMVFHGWRIERLFRFDQVEDAIRARSASIRRRMKDMPELATVPVAPSVAENEALQSVVKGCQLDPEAHYTKDAVAALLLAGTCEGDLREGFVGLYQFITRNKVRLDVGHRANLMMDCFGNLRLADPVSMRLDIDANAPLFARKWVAALLPTMQTGLSLHLAWRAVPVLTLDDACELREQLLQLSDGKLDVRVLEDNTAVAKLLQAKVETTKIFAYGRRLKELLAGSACDVLYCALNMD